MKKVVYFDQWKGASHAVPWSKSYFSMFMTSNTWNCFFCCVFQPVNGCFACLSLIASFSDKTGKSIKGTNRRKYNQGLPVSRSNFEMLVYIQMLVKTQKKIILTTQQHEKHLFTGQNKQNSSFILYVFYLSVFVFILYFSISLLSFSLSLSIFSLTKL